MNWGQLKEEIFDCRCHYRLEGVPNDAGYDFDTCGDNRRIPVDLDGLQLVQFLPLPSDEKPAD